MSVEEDVSRSDETPRFEDGMLEGIKGKKVGMGVNINAFQPDEAV